MPCGCVQLGPVERNSIAAAALPGRVDLFDGVRRHLCRPPVWPAGVLHDLADEMVAEAQDDMQWAGNDAVWFDAQDREGRLGIIAVGLEGLTRGDGGDSAPDLSLLRRDCSSPCELEPVGPSHVAEGAGPGRRGGADAADGVDKHPVSVDPGAAVVHQPLQDAGEVSPAGGGAREDPLVSSVKGREGRIIILRLGVVADVGDERQKNSDGTEEKCDTDLS